MALNIPPFHKRMVTVIRDADGRPLAVFETTKSRIVQPDGSIEETQTNESRVLADGRLIHAGMMAGPDAQLPVLCEFCQNPPRSFNPFKRRRATEGLASQGVNCSRCGRCACVLHARPGQDGLWQCIACARREGLLGRLFGWMWEEVQ